MIHELRIYEIGEGKMDQFADLFEKKLVPIYNAKGGNIPAAWRNDEKNEFIWIRAFRDDEHLEKTQEAVFNSLEFKELGKEFLDLELKIIEVRKLSPVFQPAFQ